MRFLHRHGYGIHSPWAFEFVTDVLFGKSRFYAFEQLRGGQRDRQLFRISNHLSPRTIRVFATPSPAVIHLQAPFTRLPASSQSTTDILYFDHAHAAQLLDHLDSLTIHSCVILEQPHSSSVLPVWQSLLQHPLLTSVFDLRHRAIAFFSPSRQRQTYTL